MGQGVARQGGSRLGVVGPVLVSQVKSGNLMWERQTRDALENLRAALEALKRDVLPLNERRYQIMAEPVVDMIGGLEKELRERQEKTARDCLALIQDLLPRWVELSRIEAGTLWSDDPMGDMDKSHRLMCTLYALQRCMVGIGFEFWLEQDEGHYRAQFERDGVKSVGWDELAEVAIYKVAVRALGFGEGANDTE